MDTALKQRLIGAAVLILLAVIFLPMLVTGPAPDGSKDMQGVPTTVPAAPEATVELEGRDIDFNAPADAAANTPAATVSEPAPSYIVDFAPYATAGDAQVVVDALRAAGLSDASSEPAQKGGREVHQVTIGPFATMAEAEQARAQAVKVSPVAAKVRQSGGNANATPPVTAPAAAPVETARTEPAKVSAPKEPVKDVPATKPADAGPYTVQLGSFAYEGQAEELHRKAAAAGFNTILIKGKDKEGRPVTRVRTAPVNGRQDAESLKAQIAVKLNRSAQVQKL